MNDTIAAIATAPGEGGIAIIRISGESSERILQNLFQPLKSHAFPLETHRLVYGHIHDGNEVIDECMAVIMRAPHSYTREDVVEFQFHGGTTIAQKILSLCLAQGARLAAPGEFTRRAFLNGRIDLSQAEAVMQLIQAHGERSRQAAVRQLQGGAGSFVRSCADRLYDIQAGLAACIDYPEEISEAEAVPDLHSRILSLAGMLEQACQEHAARLIREGLHVVLCGRPNVGKSSLFNALLGEDRAIVTHIPGTTRDRVEGTLHLAGTLITLTDTAGLRETMDPVESIGVARARKSLQDADLRLCVLDGSEALAEEDMQLLNELKSQDTVVLINKSDLPQVLDSTTIKSMLPQATVLTIEAQNPDSLDMLRSVLEQKASVNDALELTQPRHIDAARRAARALLSAAETLETEALDLCTTDLDTAQACLAEITGDQVEESLLDRVFSTFCVGK